MPSRWFLLSFLFLGLCGLSAAQERSTTKDGADVPLKTGNWFTRWLPFGSKTDEAKKELDAKERPEPESAAAVRGRELAILQRRQAVCLKLKEIAIQTNDEALAQKADELDQLAWRVYEKRTRSASVSVSRFSDDDFAPRTETGRAPRKGDNR
jgi:hypothetical protein